jgi:predicted dehydrogenase/threonine dehydrogenase-like Zn-dependent dehydrogenase
VQALLKNTKSGEILTRDVPMPELRPGGLLVRTCFSAISAGTERAKVEMGEKSLVQKALARPDLVKQVLEYARQNGVRAAYQKVQTRLDTYSTMGYSAAGVVLRVADGVAEFRPGDRVACAGAGHANHCQVNFIPRNLAVKVPDIVPLEAAALTTIGAIAMQGLRQAHAAVGETVAVIGAGLVGVLAIQLARASGCRVIAIDRDVDRAHRAVELGAHLGLATQDARMGAAVQEFSRYGVDAAIITAATSSAEPLELAARILRDRGRAVVVGDIGMGVSRGHVYAKELSILMSRSYGPGRYDADYEEHGRDYPIGYVRWTERRNMEAFLDLLTQGALNLAPLLERRAPVQEGSRAYDEIRTKGAYTVILEYPDLPEPPAERPRAVVLSPRSKTDILRVGCIGAGAFARDTIFPALRADAGVILESVASASGVAAESARKGFGFHRATTAEDLLEDPGVDAVFVVSRHDSHADYAARALAAGKHVFVEKPLATSREQLRTVERAYGAWLERRETPPCLMVGFNRRFAPATGEVQRFFAGHHEPMLVLARVNAGYQPADHWVHAHGGRIVGELCHFVDWARAVVASPIAEVSAYALPNGARYHRDNVGVTLRFADGSLANLLYLANGDPGVPKEYFEVFCEGGVARLEDFRSLALTRSGRTRTERTRQDKGHRHEIKRTVNAMRNAAPAPIPFDELREVTQATFAVQESLAAGRPFHLGTPRDPSTDQE